MIQKVLKVGDSAAVTIPKKSLKQLGIAIGDDVSIEIDAQTATMSVSSLQKPDARQEHITALTLDFVNRYRSDLEALKDK